MCIRDRLSRFRDGSDISRINHLPKGATTPIGEATYDCIALAMDVHAETGGAFDISIGPLLAVWTTPEHTPRKPSEGELERARAACGMDKLELAKGRLEVTVRGDERWFDLGGIGKGYALDQMAQALREREVDNALLDAGGSTLLAIGGGPDGDGWPTGTGLPDAPKIPLKDSALSGSGFSERGEHVIDPRKGQPVSSAKINAWALASSAALADALSTAFLIMEEAEIAALCNKHPEIGAILPDTDTPQ